MVKSSGATRPSVTLRLKYTDSTRSTSPESLLTVVLSGNRICTGGKSPPRRGGSTNAALQSSRLGKSLTLFALTTLPVSLSMSAYTRSPKTPRSVTSTSWSCSPPMDFTGNLHSVATKPTSSLIAMCSSQSASALSAGLPRQFPVPKPLAKSARQCSKMDVRTALLLPTKSSRAEMFLLFGHPPSEQHHDRPERRCNCRCHYPAADREKHRDVIANQRASNTHQCTCDDAAG